MAYEPGQVEKRVFELWEKGGYFRARPDDRPRERRFCMVIPPPNVTGALHLGHALNNTLQDILVRRERMRGKNTFWLVGTDHAGIATQATVEKTIRQTEGKSRHDLGREELVRRIWEWKEKFGGRIIEQLKLMGCSCDYSRERFTLDEGCAKAVRETFFKMFRDGLIYRGKRLVNWDTQLQTAVADDEVYHEEVKGHFYHFKYPIIGEHGTPAIVGEHGPPARTDTRISSEQTGESPMLPADARFGRDYVLVATTRPETMLGDTAVAVHPDPAAALDKAEQEAHAKLADAAEKEKAVIRAQLENIAERRKTLLPTLIKLRDMAKAGRKILLPLVNREIPLICDEWADTTLGSGCVKITPAHDPNDYEVGQRHGLATVNVLTPDGRVAHVEAGPRAGDEDRAFLAEAEGKRFSTEGRRLVVEALEKRGLVEKIEDRLIDLAHSDRSNMPIEPYLSDQWFVKMGDLTEEEAARVQTPFLKEYIERSQSEATKRTASAGVSPTSGSVGLRPADSEPRRVGKRNSDARGAAQPGLLSGLAQMAIDAVKSGKVRFHPPRYEKTYVDWLSEKRDWCISRQLWWGHRIQIASFLIPLAVNVGIQEGDEAALARQEEQCVAQFNAALRSAGFHGDLCFRKSEYLEKGRFQWYVCTEELRLHRWIELAVPILGHKATSSIERMHEYGAQIDEFTREFKKDSLNELQKLRSAVVHVESDLDVLDTWFSSALWPHSTLGWPDAVAQPPSAVDAQLEQPLPHGRGSDRNTGETPLLPYYYPTNVLSTAREIITLWVARMVMTGLYNVGDVPFRDVVIHPVIQDGQGRKMSKSLGNGVDPVDIIDKYGADALRFTLADLATETQDIRMPVTQEKLPDGRTINVSPKFEKGRNFCNKLWQAATGYVIPKAADVRIAIGSRDEKGEYHTSRPPRQMALFDRWIRTRLSHTVQRVNEHLDKYRFSAMMDELRSFFWTEFCDWYIEESKARLETGSDAEKNDVKVVLVQALDISLALLHPAIPFITEEIWQQIGAAIPRHHELIEPDGRPTRDKPPALIEAPWPTRWEAAEDKLCERDVGDRLQPVIRALRDIRMEVNEHLSHANKSAVRALPAAVIRAEGRTAELLNTHGALVRRLGGCDALSVDARAAKPPGAMSRGFGDAELYVPVGDLVDLAQVRASEEKKLAELRSALERSEKQLSNESFVSRADPAVVEQARQRAAELAAQMAAVREHLAELR